jgi:hypothetical protein
MATTVAPWGTTSTLPPAIKTAVGKIKADTFECRLFHVCNEYDYHYETQVLICTCLRTSSTI